MDGDTWVGAHDRDDRDGAAASAAAFEQARAAALDLIRDCDHAFVVVTLPERNARFLGGPDVQMMPVTTAATVGLTPGETVMFLAVAVKVTTAMSERCVTDIKNVLDMQDEDVTLDVEEIDGDE